jgi:hypothetical protein
MSYGLCCVTEPRLRTALQLDIFIEIPALANGSPESNTVQQPTEHTSMHPPSWKRFSATFAFRGFSEARDYFSSTSCSELHLQDRA